MKKLFRDYALGWVLLAMFVASWIGQTVTFVLMEGDPDWWEWAKDTLENWQSEFLQVLIFVVLTKYLPFKGSKEAKEPSEI